MCVCACVFIRVSVFSGLSVFVEGFAVLGLQLSRLYNIKPLSPTVSGSPAICYVRLLGERGEYLGCYEPIVENLR